MSFIFQFAHEGSPNGAFQCGTFARIEPVDEARNFRRSGSGSNVSLCVEEREKISCECEFFFVVGDSLRDFLHVEIVEFREFGKVWQFPFFTLHESLKELFPPLREDS
ncbi:MAG: hypothetical protein A2064_13170 [Spirochaetes bacterium GWB1_66_5]|nr:MAG: hypothetical protein A2064_13170 [Spirochaetes bacterium GWB1_66_5]